MTLIQLRYLVAIVDAGLNITSAARNVNATQPGISKQLRQIEEELGFRLFVRRGKSLESLTLAGGPVLERARTILAEVAGIGTFAASYRREEMGDVRLAGAQAHGRDLRPDTVVAYPPPPTVRRPHLKLVSGR